MRGSEDRRTDEEIARQVQSGDTEAFGILVNRYGDRLLRYARKFLFSPQDAEDLAQEVFLRAYENIRSFDASKRFSPWLYRVAHNTYLNALRAKKRAPLLFFDPDAIFPHPISRVPADRDANERDLREMLDRCLDAVDLKYREPMILYYYQDLDYKAIAEVLHIPVSTVGIRLKRGKERVRKIYDEREQ